MTVIDPRHGLAGQRLEIVSSRSAPVRLSSLFDHLTDAAAQFGAQ
ncbi:hypothetical protein [Mesorhizobium sp. ORM16]